MFDSIRITRIKNYFSLLILLEGKVMLISFGVITLLFFAIVKMTQNYSFSGDFVGLEQVLVEQKAYYFFIYFMNFFLIFNLAIQSSKSFKNFHNRHQMTSELILPVSCEEKFVVKIFFYLMIPIMWILLSNFILGGLFYFLYEESLENFWNHFKEYVLMDLVMYVVISFSYFFFGSIYFKSFAFFKTLISFFVLNVVTVIFLTLLKDEENQLLNIDVDKLSSLVALVIAALFVVLSYFRLKRIQLK